MRKTNPRCSSLYLPFMAGVTIKWLGQLTCPSKNDLRKKLITVVQSSPNYTQINIFMQILGL